MHDQLTDDDARELLAMLNRYADMDPEGCPGLTVAELIGDLEGSLPEPLLTLRTRNPGLLVFE